MLILVNIVKLVKLKNDQNFNLYLLNIVMLGKICEIGKAWFFL